MSSWLGLPKDFRQTRTPSKKGKTGFLRPEKDQGTEAKVNNFFSIKRQVTQFYHRKSEN